MKNLIEKTIRWFYFPPFNKLLSYKMFQYMACGGGNMLFDLALFSLLYNVVFQKENVDLGFVVISPYIAAFLIAFPITLLSGFWLMNTIVFHGSPMKNGTKLSRYMLVVGLNLLINYVGLKICVEYLHFYPTISKFLITVFCTLVSYFSQRYFTFRHYTR